MTRSQLRYLNAILTVVALLLGVLVWSQVSSQPIFATEAAAQSRTIRNSSATKGIPDAALQREKMILGVEKMTKAVEALSKDLDAGKVKVEVTNLDEIKIEVR